MKKYFSKISKKIERAKLNFENFRSKAVTRISNLASRLDQNHSQGEKKK